MPRLSLCMIARDEASLLREALASVDGLVDEAIVVDTGSVDETPEVARGFGATVVVRPWDDDYSAARNAALDRATGDWILMLDCDERLCAESREGVRTEIERAGEADAFLVDFVQRMATGDLLSRHVRFGRPAGRRFVGRVEERVEPPFDRIEYRPIRIEHVGYAHGDRTAKMVRYAALLRQALADDPTDLVRRIDLMHTLYKLGDSGWVPLFDRLTSDLDLQAPVPPTVRLLPWLEIALKQAERTGLDPERLDAIAERWFPNHLPALAERTLLWLKRDAPARAAELASRGLALWASGGFDRAAPFEPGPLRGGLHLHLGIALARLGQPAAARAQLFLAERFPATAEPARQNVQALGLA